MSPIGGGVLGLPDLSDPINLALLLVVACGALLVVSIAGLIIFYYKYLDLHDSNEALLANLGATLERHDGARQRTADLRPSQQTGPSRSQPAPKARAATAKTIQRDVTTLVDQFELMDQNVRAAERERDDLRVRLDNAEDRIDRLKNELATMKSRAIAPPVATFDRKTLAGIAAQAFRALPVEAEELEGDPRFKEFYERLDLRGGTARAALEIERCSRAGALEYQELMFEALQSGKLDAVLTSLDVIAAYAMPSRDWRRFLVYLEAGEALLTLVLFDCDIRLKKKALMMPFDKGQLGDLHNGDDRRGLRHIPSAVRKANWETGQLASPEQVLIFDCYSPGWTSPFGDRAAHGVWFDSTSMGPELA